MNQAISTEGSIVESVLETMLAVAVSGLQQMTVPIWLREGFNGTALVVAVAASQWALSRRRARARQKEIAALDEAQSPES